MNTGIAKEIRNETGNDNSKQKQNVNSIPEQNNFKIAMKNHIILYFGG